jgi:hypothetical protein
MVAGDGREKGMTGQFLKLLVPHICKGFRDSVLVLHCYNLICVRKKNLFKFDKCRFSGFGDHLAKRGISTILLCLRNNLTMNILCTFEQYSVVVKAVATTNKIIA